MCIFITDITRLHEPVMALVMNMDHITPLSCRRPCTMKANAPTDIIMKAGREIPSVLRVRIVVMACGRKPSIREMLAT